MNISEVLAFKYSGKQWSIIEDRYETLEWLDESPKPTLEELTLLIPVVQEEKRKQKEEMVLRKNEMANRRKELLSRLGISQEEFNILLGMEPKETATEDAVNRRSQNLPVESKPRN